MFQDLRTRYDWPVKKAFVDWPIRLKGNKKRISGKSLSPLWAQNKDMGTASQTLLTDVKLRRLKGYVVLAERLSSATFLTIYSFMASTLVARPFIAYREAFPMGPYDI